MQRAAEASVELGAILILKRRIRKGVTAFCADEEQSHTRLLPFRLVLEKDATVKIPPGEQSLRALFKRTDNYSVFAQFGQVMFE